MLNIICPTSFPVTTVGHTVVNLVETVKSDLNLFASPHHREKVVKIKSCPVCLGPAVSLLVGLIFSADELILLDAPATYCLQEKQLKLTTEDLKTASNRRKVVSSDNLVRVHSQRVGIGGRLLDPLIGDRVWLALGIKAGRQLFYSAAANALSFNHSASKESAQDTPDAVVFHSNEMPDGMTLKFEPTTRCNFKCEFCYGRHLIQGSLDLQDFKAILDRLPFVKAIELTGEGEPLLNVDLLDMLRLCNERNVWTHVTTNASLLQEKRCHNLLSTGIDSIAISLESFRPGQFGTIRIGGNFEEVINGIRTIARLRKERDKPLQLRLWITLLKETLSQVESIVAFAEEIGIDLIEYQVLNPMSTYSRFYTPQLRRNMLSLFEMNDIINDSATSPALRDALLSVVAVYQGKRCDVFMKTIMSNWQGFVTPCCLLKAPDFPSFGNLNSDMFEALWDCEDYRFFRFALQHGVILKSCQECPDVAASSSISH